MHNELNSLDTSNDSITHRRWWWALVGGAIVVALIVIAITIQNHEQAIVEEASTYSESQYPSLPPDPGEAGKATLEGIDVDKDGVRDDVQRRIAYMFPVDDISRKAAMQYAVGEQQMILSTDRWSAEAADRNASGGTYCLASQIGIKEAYDAVSELVPLLLNTDEREDAYVEAEDRIEVVIDTPHLDGLSIYCASLKTGTP